MSTRTSITSADTKTTEESSSITPRSNSNNKPFPTTVWIITISKFCTSLLFLIWLSYIINDQSSTNTKIYQKYIKENSSQTSTKPLKINIDIIFAIISICIAFRLLPEFLRILKIIKLAFYLFYDFPDFDHLQKQYRICSSSIFVHFLRFDELANFVFLYMYFKRNLFKICNKETVKYCLCMICFEYASTAILLGFGAGFAYISYILPSWLFWITFACEMIHILTLMLYQNGQPFTDPMVKQYMKDIYPEACIDFIGDRDNDFLDNNTSNYTSDDGRSTSTSPSSLLSANTINITINSNKYTSCSSTTKTKKMMTSHESIGNVVYIEHQPSMKSKVYHKRQLTRELRQRARHNSRTGSLISNASSIFTIFSNNNNNVQHIIDDNYHLSLPRALSTNSIYARKQLMKNDSFDDRNEEQQYYRAKSSESANAFLSIPKRDGWKMREKDRLATIPQSTSVSIEFEDDIVSGVRIDDHSEIQMQELLKQRTTVVNMESDDSSDSENFDSQYSNETEITNATFATFIVKPEQEVDGVEEEMVDDGRRVVFDAKFNVGGDPLPIVFDVISAEDSV